MERLSDLFVLRFGTNDLTGYLSYSISLYYKYCFLSVNNKTTSSCGVLFYTHQGFTSAVETKTNKYDNYYNYYWHVWSMFDVLDGSVMAIEIPV